MDNVLRHIDELDDVKQYNTLREKAKANNYKDKALNKELKNYRKKLKKSDKFTQEDIEKELESIISAFETIVLYSKNAELTKFLDTLKTTKDPKKLREAIAEIKNKKASVMSSLSNVASLSKLRKISNMRDTNMGRITEKYESAKRKFVQNSEKYDRLLRNSDESPKASKLRKVKNAYLESMQNFVEAEQDYDAFYDQFTKELIDNIKSNQGQNLFVGDPPTRPVEG